MAKTSIFALFLLLSAKGLTADPPNYRYDDTIGRTAYGDYETPEIVEDHQYFGERTLLPKDAYRLLNPDTSPHFLTVHYKDEDMEEKPFAVSAEAIPERVQQQVPKEVSDSRSTSSSSDSEIDQQRLDSNQSEGEAQSEGEGQGEAAASNTNVEADSLSEESKVNTEGETTEEDAQSHSQSQSESQLQSEEASTSDSVESSSSSAATSETSSGEDSGQDQAVETETETESAAESQSEGQSQTATETETETVSESGETKSESVKSEEHKSEDHKSEDHKSEEAAEESADSADSAVLAEKAEEADTDSATTGSTQETSDSESQSQSDISTQSEATESEQTGKTSTETETEETADLGLGSGSESSEVEKKSGASSEMPYSHPQTDQKNQKDGDKDVAGDVASSEKNSDSNTETESETDKHEDTDDNSIDNDENEEKQSGSSRRHHHRSGSSAKDNANASIDMQLTEDINQTMTESNGYYRDGKNTSELSDGENEDEAQLWVITSVFATTVKAAIVDNFFAFRDAVKRQGAKLCVAQLAYDDSPFIVGDHDADIVKSFRASKAKHLMWQKERLLNIALKILPESAKYVAWVDADVLFVDDKWIKKTQDMLRRYNIVQLFSEVRYLMSDQTSKVRQEISYSYSEGTPLDLTGYKAPRSTSYVADIRNRPNAPNREDLRMGLAWASKREVMEKVMFPEFCVVGGGDKIMLQAIMPSYMPNKDSVYHHSSSIQRRETIGYQKTLSNAVGGEDNVGYLETVILHLFHGKRKDRYYIAREKLLRDIKFNTEKHLIKEPVRFSESYDGRHHSKTHNATWLNDTVWSWKGSPDFIHRIVQKFESYFEIKEHGKDMYGGTQLFRTTRTHQRHRGKNSSRGSHHHHH